MLLESSFATREASVVEVSKQFEVGKKGSAKFKVHAVAVNAKLE